MTQMAEAMGWRSYASANSHYGGLAKLMAAQLEFDSRGCHLSALCTFIAPEEVGDHWLVIMRSQVAEALERLEWVTPFKHQRHIFTPATDYRLKISASDIDRPFAIWSPLALIGATAIANQHAIPLCPRQNSPRKSSRGRAVNFPD